MHIFVSIISRILVIAQLGIKGSENLESSITYIFEIVQFQVLCPLDYVQVLYYSSIHWSPLALMSQEKEQVNNDAEQDQT
jgi:hypothetical protein